MTTENRIDYQSSQIASLEAKFSALGNQADDQRSEGELHAAPQQTVDPKGRKIWEAQWRGDYGVLLAYVPINALVIDGENVEVEADDKDGDEVTVTAGTWYLHIYKNESGEGYSADFDDSATGSRDGETAKFNIKIFDIHEDGYVEKQYVVGSIVMGGSSGDDDGNDKYFADERSVSRCGNESTDPTQIFNTNYFHIYGFGKFTAQGYAAPIGTFQQATDLEIDPDSGESTNVAFLVRSGNSSSPDSNFIGYRKLKIGSSGLSSPFQYTKTTSVNQQTHQTVTTHKLVNCKFYWQGEMKELADFDVTGVIGGGSVYLRGTQAEPTSSTPEPEWQFSIGTSAAQAPSNGKVLNFKLYDFANSKPSVDYRTTFLSLEDTTPKARIVVQKPNGQGSIMLDATGDKPKVVISDGTHSINLDLSQIPDTCQSGNYGLHSLSYKDENGDTQIYHGVFCEDIDLSDIATNGKTIDDVDVQSTTTETIVTFYYTDETSTEIHIPHGLRGKKGDKGDDGDTPEVWGVKNGEVTTVFADGEVIATINDGHTPQITAEKKDGVTTIYVDGNAVAQIQDGGVGQYDSITCISGIKFEISGGKLKAIVSKQTFNVPDTFEMHPVEEIDAQTIDVCDVSELDVVTEEEYSASSHQFTNKRKRVKVIGTATDATGQTPFTATPLSGE